MKNEKSAGILVYRVQNGELQVLLGKCGGPKYEKMSVGAWNIPKGHVEEGENMYSAAIREFSEETSLELNITNWKEIIDLGEAKTSSKKIVKIFAVERDFGENGDDKVRIKSNMCTTEWPPKSGKKIEIPEMAPDAYYFKMNVARRMIFAYQRVFLDRLEEAVFGEKLEDKTSIKEDVAAPAAAADSGAVVAEPATATPGVTTDSTFGPGKSSTDSIVKPVEKKADDPGLTTSDIASLYTLQKGKKKYPLFKRVSVKKFK